MRHLLVLLAASLLACATLEGSDPEAAVSVRAEPLVTLAMRGYALQVRAPDQFDVVRQDGAVLAEGLSGMELFMTYPALHEVLELGLAGATLDASLHLSP